MSRFLTIFFLLFVGFSFVPVFSESPPPIVINEISWMGTQVSSANEWIEIFNASNKEVDVSSWILRSKSNSESGYTPNIVLSGSIQANGYCLFERTADDTLPDVGADYIYTGALTNSGEKAELVDEEGNLVDLIDASGGWFAGDNDAKLSMERKDPLLSGSDPSNWQTSTISPGTPESNGCSTSTSFQTVDKTEITDTEEVEHPVIDFSYPKSVVAGSEFTVTINLSKFNSGTYFLKVRAGIDGKFYDGRTKGTNGKWLAWNVSWADFPKVAISSSGSASKTVSAMVDEDAGADSYLIEVRVYDGDGFFNSEPKALKVSAAIPVESKQKIVNQAGSGSESSSPPVNLSGSTGSEGEVLGEESKQAGEFQLNFYLIVGIFGLIVGSGGVILAFRRGPKELQKAGSRKLGSENP